MKLITHKNTWWWGTSYTIITDNGKATIELAITTDRPDCGYIRSLMVHKSVRREGIGNALLMFVEDKARKLRLEQVYLTCRKNTFLVDWYQRYGYTIYDENVEESKGQTVAMYKYLD